MLPEVDYKKYYELENLLFEDLNKKFHKEGFLSAAELFCIIIWKANRAKTKIKKKLLAMGSGDLESAAKALTQEVHAAATAEERLSLLLSKWRFGLPMATAILTVLYPNDFSVYDYRLRDQLQLPNITSSKKYFSIFLPKLKASGPEGPLRDKDKFYWGKSFYKDLIKLIGD